MDQKRLLAVCDNDINYALALSSALNSALYGRFEISTFNNIQTLCDHLESNEVDTVIVSESAYDKDMLQVFGVTVLLLKESPDFMDEDVITTDRFQSREKLVGSILEALAESFSGIPTSDYRAAKWKVVGIYSPIRRSLQTNFALSLGQMLGAKSKVLYMNFENFSGFSGWFNTEFKSDIVDLLYFFDCEKEKLSLKLPLMIHKIGDLDILPPAGSYHDTYDVGGAKWIQLFETIGCTSDYEYLILDLTDAMQGLMDVMGYCDRIYTLVKDDIISRAKLAQYEAWMVEHSKADIVGKTLKFDLPQFTDIPADPYMLTHCELAGYVRAIIDDDEIGA
ncbi:MAG: hypothetical protein K6G12_07460 [Lachnospiraceae bacterium]|nr:hypothetical protein [Lachnospiraceae bacterium]